MDFKRKTDNDGKKTMMVRITIKKARLVVKIFSDKFKELTTVRLSHS